MRGADERGPLRRTIPVGTRPGISNMAFIIQHDGRNASQPRWAWRSWNGLPPGASGRERLSATQSGRVDDANPSRGLRASRSREDWCYRAGEAVTTDSPSCPTDDAPPVLDLGFDSGTLHTVRAQMRACVSHAGFPEGQAEDVVLAVHELAANAVSHGGGAGRLRVWNLAGTLYCQVDDGDSPMSSRQGDDHDGTAVIKPSGSSDRASVNSLPREHGHGLWVVRQVADQMQSLSGPGGTSVLVRFDRGAMRHFA